MDTNVAPRVQQARVIDQVFYLHVCHKQSAKMLQNIIMVSQIGVPIIKITHDRPQSSPQASGTSAHFLSNHLELKGISLGNFQHNPRHSHRCTMTAAVTHADADVIIMAARCRSIKKWFCFREASSQ